MWASNTRAVWVGKAMVIGSEEMGDGKGCCGVEYGAGVVGVEIMADLGGCLERGGEGLAAGGEWGAEEAPCLRPSKSSRLDGFEA